MSLISRIIKQSMGRGGGRGGGGLGGGQSDEEVIDAAVQEMFGMTGNAGQDAILNEAMPNFIDWAKQALEGPEGAGDWPDVLDLNEDKYDGTDDIWEVGYEMISEQSGFHDSEDEAGEGAGTPF